MRFQSQKTTVTLFPFLSVLLCTMGILAFLSISFLLVAHDQNVPMSPSKKVTFEWIGAPASVKPIFFRCYKNRIVYYNFFKNRDYTLFHDELLKQIEGGNPIILKYLIQLRELNSSIKKDFKKTEYYPLLLVYPEGIFTSELVMALIEKIKGLSFGLEPMLTQMDTPYQGLNSR